jgi:glycosyltransferase involved in cell wall biosynthesis
LKEAVAVLDRPCEIVFVDDGSKDATFSLTRDLASSDPNLRVVKFRRNYGQTPAMAAGIDQAKGDIIVTMDGDLQNDPSDIPAFIEKIEEGYDLVAGIRQKRQDKLLTRKIPSKIANWLIGKVTGVPIKDNGCSLKAYRASVIKHIPLYSEMHRFIPAMMSLSGARIVQIPVQHHARQFGKSKYGLNRTYKVLLDLLMIKTIIGYCARPLQWFSLLASGMFAVALLFGAFAVWNLLSGSTLPLVVHLGTSMVFGMTGLFLFFAGIIADRIYKTGDVRIESFTRLTSGVH